MEEIIENTGKKQKDWLFKKGQSGNPAGRPKGTRNFETDFDEAVEELAKENGMTRSEARKLLLKVAFKQAQGGNFSFYKDIHDRIYGQPKSNVDITSGDEKITLNIIDFKKK
jgi:hypothetical protein